MAEPNVDILAEEQELADYEDEVGSEEEREVHGNGGSAVKDRHASVHASGFRDLLLNPELLKAISDSGFEHPSEVQQECIPQAIMGTDILCQAKSGMGKTAVFVISVLQMVDPTQTAPQCLVLVHTRELALQVQLEFERLGKYKKDIKSGVFYGGIPEATHVSVLKDNKYSIIIGTPGRIKRLVELKALDLGHLRFFVCDECDQLLGRIELRRDVQKIFVGSVRNKQVMMFSATMDSAMQKLCQKFMVHPQIVTVSDKMITLEGLKQYYLETEEDKKNKLLTDVLDMVEFNQIIIFVKSPQRAKALASLLHSCNFPAVALHGNMTSQERIEQLNRLRNFDSGARVIVTTGALLGRGVDLAKVNVVVNYDFPESTDSYLHRAGRAGRFGTKGLCVSFVSGEAEKKRLDDVQARFTVKLETLPEKFDNAHMQS